LALVVVKQIAALTVTTQPSRLASVSATTTNMMRWNRGVRYEKG